MHITDVTRVSIGWKHITCTSLFFDRHSAALSPDRDWYISDNRACADDFHYSFTIRCKMSYVNTILTNLIFFLFYFECFPLLFNLYGGVNDVILHKEKERHHDLLRTFVTCYLAFHNGTNGLIVVQYTNKKGSGHIILAVQVLALGQSINLHSALSLSY